MLVDVRLDQTRVDRERLAANQARHDADRHHPLEHAAQGIALAEALVPRTGERRMIRDPVLNPEPAIPAVGEVHLDLAADHALRPDGEHVADDEHPHHQLGIDRWPAGVRVIGRQLLVNPAEVEHGVDLAHEVVRRHHVVEIELVEELALPRTCRRPIIARPAATASCATESRFGARLNGSSATRSDSTADDGGKLVTCLGWANSSHANHLIDIRGLAMTGLCQPRWRPLDVGGCP